MASNLDKEQNAKLAKEHPERVVDGIYYATDEALAEAKAKKEAEVSKETARVTKELAEEQKKTESTVKIINNTVYGKDSSIVEKLEGMVGGIEVNAILGNAQSISERQKLLNFKTFVNDFKEPNPGKPPHNEDAFPVDQKIEEFESHQPMVKIHKVTTHVHGQAATIAAMQASDTAEKRIVRLENNMATIMRYLFRLGSRMAINCVYWGGTSVFNKYKCIRCLRDDRISDGQFMQIDQCLTCTKFEPIVGQVYEIMNDMGVGVAQILDDNQMSYMNNQAYIDLSRIENFQTSPKKANFDLGKVLYPENGDEQGFKPQYGAGIKVNWQLVPVEQQKCHINWRQSINDDGSGLGRLGSWQENSNSLGRNLTNVINSQAMTNTYVTNQKSMQSNSGNADYGSYVSSGSSFTSNNTDVAKTLYMNEHEAVQKATAGANDVDAIAILAASTALGTKDYSSIISKYRQCANTIGSPNIGLIWLAYGGASTEIIKMYIDDTLEEWLNPPKPDGEGESSGDDGSSSSVPVDDNNGKPKPKKEPTNKDKVLWTEFMPLIIKGLQKEGKSDMSGLDLFPKICFMYVQLLACCTNSSFDGGEWGFPFTDDLIRTYPDNRIYMTSPFGWRDSTDSFHEGIDIQPEGCSGPEAYDTENPFCACKAGVVVEAGDGGWSYCNGISIDHRDGTFSRYLHAKRVLVTEGQEVKKGDKIGIIGGYGGGNNQHYAYHLHLEFGRGDGYQKIGTNPDTVGIDPMTVLKPITGVDDGYKYWSL